MTDQQKIAGPAVEDQRDTEPAGEPEIDIQAIKSRIEQAVARRQAAGQTSFINASARLIELLSRRPVAPPVEAPISGTEVPQFRSQPEFFPNRDNHYQLSELLKYHDREFVWNAYRALLRREPDTEGLNAFLGKLRNGRYNKIDVLAGLRYSLEGKRNRVRVDGLAWPAITRRLYRMPVIGYVAELFVGIARLPSLLRYQRQIESYLIAQQELIVDHFNQTTAQLRPSSEPSRSQFALALSQLEQQQKAIARAQHQQLAALFHEQQRTARTGHIPFGEADAQGRLALDELYAEFENEFRGAREDVKQSLKIYLPLLKDAGINQDILDIGCGRGEWLELLRDEGLPARGVESNSAMVRGLRRQTLEIVEDDAIEYLRGLPQDSLGAVTAFHFVEHLGFEDLVKLFDQVNRVLKPGGLLIVETPNPKNLVVGACNFYSDPTHHRPLFPETLQFILNHRGFARTQLQYLHPVESSPFQDGSEAAQALNSWLFSARDFAIIAHKSGPEEPGSTLQVSIEDRLETVKLARCVSQTGYEFFARPRTDDQRIFQDVVDLNEYNLPSQFDRQDIVIDLGAHIGSFSCAVLTRGAGKVYAYEAHPANHAIARRNLEQFGERAACHNLAVWRSDTSGQVLFNDRIDGQSTPNTGGHAVVYNDGGLPVQTIGLDDILREASNGFKKRIRLLKIDCEGAEYPILFTAKHLDIIEEICGEYHVVESHIIPERAKVRGMPERFDSHGLREFLERSGWSAEMQPNSQDPNLGHFRARQGKSLSGAGK